MAIRDRYNCADLNGDGTIPPGICYNYGGMWEADCLMPLGVQCALADGLGGLFLFGCGATSPSATLACDLDEGCVPAQSTCQFADQWNNCCSGNRLVVVCADYSCIERPVVMNCASAENGNGTCNAAFCEHSTAGGLCNDNLILCTGGLTCQNVINGWGTCQ